MVGSDDSWSLILPVDQNVGTDLVKLGSTCAPLQPPSFVTIHLKNLQKNRAAPLRPIALQRSSQWLNHQILQEQTLKNSQGTVQCSLSQYAQELSSVKSIIWTCVYLKSSLGNPFIPGHFLSPGSYAAGHVAHIQSYTCHHLEPPWLGRCFWLSFG